MEGTLLAVGGRYDYLLHQSGDLEYVSLLLESFVSAFFFLTPYTTHDSYVYFFLFFFFDKVNSSVYFSRLDLCSAIIGGGGGAEKILFPFYWTRCCMSAYISTYCTLV